MYEKHHKKKEEEAQKICDIEIDTRNRKLSALSPNLSYGARESPGFGLYPDFGDKWSCVVGQHLVWIICQANKNL